MDTGRINVVRATDNCKRCFDKWLEADKAYDAACAQASENNGIASDGNVRNAVMNLRAARERLDVAHALMWLEEACHAYDVACHTGDGVQEAVFQVHEAGSWFHEVTKKKSHSVY